MLSTILTPITAVCLSLAASDAPAINASGWYTTSTDETVVVLPSGRGGYRIVRLHPFRSDWLAPGDDGTFEWRDNRTPRDRVVRFNADGNGSVIGFTWSGSDGEGAATRTNDSLFQPEDLTCTHGDITIAGNLLLPPGEGPHPAVVTIQGSGYNDRDNGWFLMFAEEFARQGIATFIPDKRGCGQSTGDWQAADFTDYARDTLAVVAALRMRSDIGPVGLLGGSQGGAVAPIAGVLDPTLAFVVNVSGSTLSLGEQVRHEVTQDLRNDGESEASIAAAMRLFDRSHHYIRTGEGWDAYLAALQEVRRGPHKRAALGFISNPDNGYWSWWRSVIDVDPIASWSKLEPPALIVYGADDERDNVPVARSVERIRNEIPDNRDITVRVFENTGHGLFDTDGRIRSDFLEVLIAWLKPHIESAQDRAAR